MISTKFYLDVRSQKHDGYPLKLRISVKREAAYISLDVTLPVDQWDPVRQVVRKNCANSKKLNEYISRRKYQIDDCIRSLILSGAIVGASAISVKEAVIKKLYDVESSEEKFMVSYQKFADSHENARTREIYMRTSIAMHKYDPEIDNYGFSQIDRRWLDGFSNWLSNDCKNVDNSKTFHFRCIRATFNYAIDSEITTFYPFRKFKFRNTETRKRSLSVEDLRSIFSAEVHPRYQIHIDAFKLIFLLIGINSIDLFKLKYSDLKDGRITYVRSKTKRFYDIKVLNEAQEIIDKYPGQGNKLVSFGEGQRSYLGWTIKMNYALSLIHSGVTSYYARHSWATIAASMDIPKETIAAALGHGGHSVTDVYIDFDAKKVDEANRRVADYVLYGKLS